MQKVWEFKSSNNSKKSLIERLLAIRGITKKNDIKTFLNPLEMEISNPNVFCDMEIAKNRIVEAIEQEQKILIYGDFDADGITSTSVLIKTLKHLSANVDYYIPDRENEGHGMHTKTLVKIMTAKKPKLIITVDCGISNLEEVKFLNSFGIEVIITDHHEAPEELPSAFAIINPKAPNSLDGKLSAGKIIELTSLAGCGVAFKLAHALLDYYNKTEFVYEILPFVAVGTIADIVPLIGENRYYVAKGLDLITKGQHTGLTKLIESAGYNLKSGITSENIAFGIAPRINATGRLDSVETSLKVLLSDNKAEINMAVQTLNELNKIRQTLCENTFLEAEEMYLKNQTNENAIVLFNKNWNIGIIGIVASRFVEKYYKPAFIISYHEESKQYRCSARSIKGINLYNALDANAELFDGFGGHEMAAGFSFSEENASLEQVKQALNETIKEMSEGLDLKPTLNIDLLLDEKDLDITIVDEISKLEPFGAYNPAPVFAIKDFVLKEKTLMGENKKHLRLKIQGKDSVYTCIWWSHGDISLIPGDKLDVAFSPQINVFNGITSLQLIIEDVRSENLKENIKQEQDNGVKIFDHREKKDIFIQVDDYVRTSKMDIIVYAENKNVVESIKNYKSLSEKIVTRQNLRKADSIMFFDYPPTPEDFNNILKTVSPYHVHYMACKYTKPDEQNLLKTLSGMIKYACNNKNGIFELEKAASFLSLSKECIEILLQILSECELILIEDKNKDIYKLQYKSNIELMQVLKNPKYKLCKKILDEISDFKENTDFTELLP